MQTLLKAFLTLALPKGRLARRWYWTAIAGLIALMALLLPLVELGGRWAIVLGFLPFYWAAFALMSKRCHDAGLSAAWLFVLFVPVVGVIWWFAVLGFRRGDKGDNQYGPDPRPAAPDYLTVQAIT